MVFSMVFACIHLVLTLSSSWQACSLPVNQDVLPSAVSNRPADENANTDEATLERIRRSLDSQTGGSGALCIYQGEPHVLASARVLQDIAQGLFDHYCTEETIVQYMTNGRHHRSCTNFVSSHILDRVSFREKIPKIKDISILVGVSNQEIHRNVTNGMLSAIATVEAMIQQLAQFEEDHFCRSYRSLNVDCPVKDLCKDGGSGTSEQHFYCQLQGKMFNFQFEARQLEDGVSEVMRTNNIPIATTEPELLDDVRCKRYGTLTGRDLLYCKKYSIGTIFQVLQQTTAFVDGLTQVCLLQSES